MTKDCLPGCLSISLSAFLCLPATLFRLVCVALMNKHYTTTSIIITSTTKNQHYKGADNTLYDACNNASNVVTDLLC